MMTIRNWGGKGGMIERIHRRKEMRVFQQDLLSSLRMRTEKEWEPQQVVCSRGEEKEGRGVGLGERRESGAPDSLPVSLLVYLFKFGMS